MQLWGIAETSICSCVERALQVQEVMTPMWMYGVITQRMKLQWTTMLASQECWLHL